MSEKKVKEERKERRTLELNVYERLSLQRFLPEQANYVEALVAKDLREKIVLTQDEVKEYEVKSEGAMMKWNSKGNVGKRFEFTQLEIDLLKKGFEKMDKEGKIITEGNFLVLCTKIKEA